MFKVQFTVSPEGEADAAMLLFSRSRRKDKISDTLFIPAGKFSVEFAENLAVGTGSGGNTKACNTNMKVTVT